MKIISLDKGCFAFILGLLLWCSHMHANYIDPCVGKAFWQSAVTGTVSDATGPLPGVTIYVKGTSSSAVSDENGRYTITAAIGDMLVFSFIGFRDSEQVVASPTLDVVLMEDAAQLQEVVINAGYYSVKDKVRTGSIARITSKDIEDQPVANVLATMQGRMAGVDITQDNGMAGGGFQIRIRGINSLRADGNEPLYIIDGVPFSSESIGAPNTSGVFISMTNPLNSINPADISNIEVLKDADATAIYGSRGANGVVLITTKKGKAGKTSFSAEASTGFAKVARFAELLSTQEYIAMREQAVASDGLTEIPEWANDINGRWDRNRYTDWQKELIGGTAQITDLRASMSGGSASTQFLLSGNYRTETTVMPGDFRYDKGAVHFSANHASQDEKFRLTFSGNYVTQKNNQATTDLSGVALTLAPNAPALYDSEGNLNWEEGTFENPLAALQSGFLARINSLTANTVLSYNVLPDLQLRGSFGYNEIVNDERRTTPSAVFNPAYGLDSSVSSLNINQTALRSWIIEPQVNYNLSLGKGVIEALAGATFQNQRTTRLYQTGNGFSSNSLINDLASARSITISRSDETIYKYHAIFARLNYNYDSRYIINITGRRDGSSRFGPGRQFANFGAVGAAWLFSNESWMKDITFLSFGKIRGSYGITGNDQIGDYQFLNTYTSTGIPYQGTNGLEPSRLYNPAFGWETNRKFEVGLETGFYGDRIYLTTAYYINRSSDQLVGIPLPGTTGFTSLNANLDATVENRGLEVTLRTENIRNEAFSWITSFNISANRNKLLSFPGLANSPYANTFVIGESVNIRKLYHYTGIDPVSGTYTFEDANGDGALTSLADKNRLVDFAPLYFGGLLNQFNYKGVQLDILLQFAKQERFEFNAGAPGTWVNQLQGHHTGWQQPGDNATQQVLTLGYNSAAMEAYDRYTASDAAVVDASYIKLKNISLSYDLPLKQMKNLKCRIFVQGQNLLTFTKYKGTDPEFKFAGQLPPLRVFSSGIQLSF